MAHVWRVALLLVMLGIAWWWYKNDPDSE